MSYKTTATKDMTLLLAYTIIICLIVYHIDSRISICSFVVISDQE